MNNSENIDIASMDDITLLYTAIYSDPEMSALLSDNLQYIHHSDMADALYFAAMGKKEDLLSLMRR